MSTLSAFFPIIVYLIAIMSSFIICLRFKTTSPQESFETITGLRGFLAISVFIHHASIWQQYLKTGQWQGAPTAMLAHLGQTSVTFFFMITGFLFVYKLINANQYTFSWHRFFVARFLRLAPLYYSSLLVIFLFIMFKTHWQIYDTKNDLFESLFNWFCFTLYQTPLVNKYWILIVNSGVEWTLTYEWLYYFSLPLFGLFILKIKPKAGYLLAAALFIIFFYCFHKLNTWDLYPFVGGGAVPFLLKYSNCGKYLKGRMADVLVLLCLLVVTQFQSLKSDSSMILITIAFTLIVCGNSLFGILNNRYVKFLGSISYSIYLLHGIVLFGIFNFGIGFEESKYLSPAKYSLIIFSITPLVVLISFLAFKFIETPFIRLGKRRKTKRCTFEVHQGYHHL